MKKTYIFIGSILILFICIISILLHPKTSQYLAQKFLKDDKIEYSKIEGSFLTGISLYDLKYTDALVIKSLHIDYNLLMLLSPRHELKSIEASQVLIRPKDLLTKKDDNSSEFIMPEFAISKLRLNKVKLIIDDETLSFDLNTSGIRYKTQLDIKKLLLQVSTSYAKAKIEGTISSNLLQAKASVHPKPSLLKKHLSSFKDLPQTYILDLDASLQKVQMHTHLDKLKTEQNLSIKNTDVNLSYIIQDDCFTSSASYLLAYEGLQTQIKQVSLFTSAGAYTTELNATLLRSPIELPFKYLDAQISGDKNSMTAQINADSLQLDISSKEYKSFLLHAQDRELALSFIPELPEALKKNILFIKADARLEISPFSLKGRFDSQGLYSTIEGSFELDKESRLFSATLNPKTENEIYKEYPIQKFSPLNLVLYDKNETAFFNIDAQVLNLSLIKKDADLSAWGNLASANFNATGRMEKTNETRLNIIANIPSINALISEFTIKDSEQKLFFDAEVDINTSLSLSKNLEIKSRINLPWYIIRPDSQTSYKGENLYLESRLVDKELYIDKYSINIMDHNIYSNRSSKISFDKNESIDFKEFWIYDNLLLTGLFNPKQMQGNLHLQSEHFKYESKEGNLTLKTDIRADFESDGRQNIEGDLTLLDGVITYEPSSHYSLSDDIVIIQDIKPLKKTQRFINIHINAAKEITYKGKEIDIKIMPDLILWQEPNTHLGIFGMLGIQEGELTGGGKLFEFKKSEIYFKGDNPINPYLNLNLHHQTLDYVDIQIFITNTLASPVIILTSTPALSQNDIMSYLLFGEPASSTFDNSGQDSGNQAVSSLLLATGLKQIFNDTTGLHIDTLNILTNEEGSLAYEIGARVSKQVRLVYKNDTTSSVILQYSLTKSIRIDVDTHETGQGVSILYIKDF